MITVKVALRLAVTRDARQRWRQITVIGSAAVVALALFLGVALLQAHAASGERTRARELLAVSAGQPVVLRVHPVVLTDSIGSFPIIWLDPQPGRDQAAAIPPGLDRLPEPGTAVLSPGLIDQDWTAEDFGLKPSTAGKGKSGAIGASGLQASSERRVYARPPAGQKLAQDGQATAGFRGSAMADGGQVGPGLAFKGVPTEFESEFPPYQDVLLLNFLLILIPSTYLTIGAARAMSPMLQLRAETLWRLGAARRQIAAIVALETLLLATLGTLLAAACWQLALEDLRQLPPHGITLLPGDLKLPLGRALSVAVLTPLVFALASACSRIVPKPHRVQAQRVHLLRLVPLILALSCMLLSCFGPFGRGNALLLIVGVSLTLLVLPLALPALVSVVSARLAEGSPLAWLAGRRLSMKATHLTRPAAMVGALILITGASGAYYENLRMDVSEFSAKPYSAVTLEWANASPMDFPKIQNKLSQFVVISRKKSDGGLIFRDCRQLNEVASLLGTAGCITQGPGRDFVEAVQDLPGEGRIQIGGDQASGEPGWALILRRERTADREIQQAVGGIVPAAMVMNITHQDSHYQYLGWLQFYWLMASAILVISLLREVGDRGLLALSGANLLRRLTLTEPEVRGVNRWTLYFPLVLSVPLGFATAVLFAAAGRESGLTGGKLGRISLFMLGAISLGLIIFRFITMLNRKMERYGAGRPPPD